MTARGGAGRLVWGGYAVLAVAALAFTLRYGRNVPYWDDWRLVPELLGGRPLDFEWLWHQCNEHRLPLSKALMAALARLSDGDLRWAMFASALMLCAVPALLLVTLQRLAAPLRWTDLVVPIALLHWGHKENLLGQIQVHFVLAVALFTSALAVMLLLVAPGRAAPDDAPARRVRPWALLALALPLPWTSGLGLCLAPPLALWMVWAAPRLPAPERRALRAGAALLALGVAVLLANLPSSPDVNRGFMGVGATAATTLRCLTTAVGPVGRELWPWSGLFVALIGAATVMLLLAVWRRDPARRLGASVLLVGLAALGGLALVIGESRAGLGWEAGFAPRYTTPMAAGLCCAYLAWRLHGSAWRRLRVPEVLAVALLLALPLNTRLGLRQARAHAADLDAFAADVVAGLDPVELAREHGPRVCPNQRLVADLQLLRQRKRWLYRPAD